MDYDGQYVLINTAAGRIKKKNVRIDRRIVLSISNESNPYEMVAIRGIVEEITEKNTDMHVDKLAKRYLGLDKYPFRSPLKRGYY